MFFRGSVVWMGMALSCASPSADSGAVGAGDAAPTEHAPAAPVAVDPAAARVDTIAHPLSQRQAAFRGLKQAMEAMEKNWEPPSPSAPAEDWVSARDQRTRMEAAVWGQMSDSLGLGMDVLEGIWSEGVSSGWE